MVYLLPTLLKLFDFPTFRFWAYLIKGYSRNVPDEGYYSNVPDEGYYSNVPDEGYYSNVPDEGYYSNVPDKRLFQKRIVRFKLDIYVFIDPKYV